MPQLVEQMLHVTHPRPVTIENLIEALNSALQHNLDVQAARARVGGQDLVDAEVLLDALDGIGAIQRVSGSALALKGKPAKGYWAWRPIEREVIDYLHSVNGTALNRDIFRHFKGDPSVETRALSKALRVLPYLYAPSPISTALRPWAL